MTTDATVERVADALRRLETPGDKREWGDLPAFKRTALMQDARVVLAAIAADGTAPA